MMGISSNYLCSPKTDCIHENGCNNSLAYGACTVQGWRCTQEDAFICLMNLENGYNFFGVFDGHGGPEISNLAKNMLHSEIQYYLKECKDVELALYLGFLAFDNSAKDPAYFTPIPSSVESDSSDEDLQNVAGPSCRPAKRRKCIFSGDPDSLYDSDTVQYLLNESLEETDSEDIEFEEHMENLEKNMEASDSDTEASIGGSDEFTDDEISDCESTTELIGMEKNDDETGCDSNVPGPSGCSKISVSGKSISDITSPTQYTHLEEREIVFQAPADESIGVLSADVSEPTDHMPGSSKHDMESNLLEKDIPKHFSRRDHLNMINDTGSTATVAIVTESKIYIANIGDSRCVLSRSGVAIDLSVDHKPDDPEELARIRKAGCEVKDGRINQCLNLSRAFGDFRFKKSEVPFEQCVSTEPHIKCINIQKEDEFLIIASDGIWNSFSSQNIVDFLNIRLRSLNCDINDVCEEIIQLIIPPNTLEDEAGCDNMSLIIIRLHYT